MKRNPLNEREIITSYGLIENILCREIKEVPEEKEDPDGDIRSPGDLDRLMDRLNSQSRR